MAVHPGALGDVILFGRLLSRLGGPVTLVTGSEKGRLLAEAGAVEKALDFDALPMHEAFTDTPVGECGLTRLLGSHDRLISCFAAGNRAAELRLAAMCGAQDAAFPPVRPPASFEGHLLELWADLLGVPFGPAEPAGWPIPDSWRRAARAALADIGIVPPRPYLVFHPGAGARRKCWPLDRFVELSRLLASARGPGAGIVFVVGPVEHERWGPGRIEPLRRQGPLLLSPPLSELAGVLAGAGGFVGNDSGVAHLAAAVGTPTVVLFGPTRPRHFAPRGQAVTTIAAEAMEDIPVGRVLAALRGAAAGV